MLAYLAASAASAPPPRPGPPLIPAPRASSSPAAARPPTFPASAAEAALEEDALPATAENPKGVAESSGGASPPEEDGPPLEVLEAQMHAEIQGRDPVATSRRGSRGSTRATEDEEEQSGGRGAALPDLETLVERLPAELRETVDELLRVKFTQVKKVPKRVLVSGDAKAAPAPRGAA